MNKEIKLVAHSKHTERDWYGDWSCYGNPLNHYLKDSKLWRYEVEYASGRGDGIEKITVYTTEEALITLGWENDLKYIKE